MRAALWEEKGIRGAMTQVTAKAVTMHTARERVRERKVFTEGEAGD
jgi:hypothetical protein